MKTGPDEDLKPFEKEIRKEQAKERSSFESIDIALSKRGIISDVRTPKKRKISAESKKI